MANEDINGAINYLKLYRKSNEILHNMSPKDSVAYYATDKSLKYLDMAIKALEQEPKTDVLDKIRAEIDEEKEHAYADFERYKVEYLGQDWEDALDSLPQDDFRYGMERAIEIINKYRTGK